MTKVHFTSLFSEEALQDALDRGLVSKRKHTIHNIWIYNYTAECKWNWEWTDVTLNCRGLILDSEGYIVARSLPKFFSYEQLDGKLPKGDFVVEEKLDGSMLLVFKYNGELITATKGSFESEQALEGRKIIETKYPNFKFEDGFTYVFEVIY